MNVETTGTSVTSTSRRSSSAARALTAPLPARTRGRSAARNRSAAAASASALGRGSGTGSGAANGRSSVGSPATPSGSSRWVTPGFSSSASLNAFRTDSWTMAGSFSCAFHFVTGSNRSSTSSAWWLSWWSRSRPPWQVTATTGLLSRWASATPVSRFVAPGPSVERQTPAAPVSRPWTSAMNAAPCSWRQGTNATSESRSEKRTSSVSSPGSPNTWSTPSASRPATSRSETVRSVIYSTQTVFRLTNSLMPGSESSRP
jgi:hypothetical protein